MACTCDMHGRGGMHCRGCCQTFTGVTAYDRHHDINYLRCPAVTCLYPADAGLVPVRDMWGLPSDARSRARLAALRAERARTLTLTQETP